MKKFKVGFHYQVNAFTEVLGENAEDAEKRADATLAEYGIDERDDIDVVAREYNTTGAEELLNNCPCCGSDRVQLISSLDVAKMAIDTLDMHYEDDGDEEVEGYYVICNATCGGCGMMSGWAKTEALATRKWNKRP